MRNLQQVFIIPNNNNIEWAKKTGLLFRVNNFATFNGIKACNMSKVS